ncbi:MAG: type VI secretion system contractile sheath small subunit [Desulfovibrionaceae bacterium]|nr:type VI secretion system contractile sheath small subunit [Desulfovibrionaceae bacterium]
MAKEGSVAPKERVNIVYRPSAGDVKEDVELPLKLMVIGDFTMRTDDRSVEDRDVVSVDKDNFGNVMNAQNLGLRISVPNRLSDDPDSRMNVDLKFQNLRDFEPDAIARQVPELAKMLELRDALKALKGPLSNIPEFRRRIQETITDEKAREELLKALGLNA